MPSPDPSPMSTGRSPQMGAPVVPSPGLRGMRVLDVALSLAALTLLAPLFAIVALGIKANSVGPVFWRQPRLSRDQRPFDLYSFRTTHVELLPEMELDEAEEAHTARPGTVTGFGTFLRRAGFHRLPHLVNILKGDLSLVGPRPHAPGERVSGILWADIDPRYEARFAVRPGLIGVGRLRSRSGRPASLDEARACLETELAFIRTGTLGDVIAYMADRMKVWLFSPR